MAGYRGNLGACLATAATILRSLLALLLAAWVALAPTADAASLAVQAVAGVAAAECGEDDGRPAWRAADDSATPGKKVEDTEKEREMEPVDPAHVALNDRFRPPALRQAHATHARVVLDERGPDAAWMVRVHPERGPPLA